MIEQFLSTDRFTSREQLCKMTGLNDRDMRREVSELKKEVPVIFNSRTKGYRLAKDIKTLTLDEAIEEDRLVFESMKDICGRVAALQDQVGVYVKYREDLHKSLANGR